MQTLGINHVALLVQNLARSRDFYVDLFGATVVREDDNLCFLDVGGGDFLALFARQPSMIEHFCFTIDGYDPDQVAAALEEKGLVVHRREDRVFVEDPDGLPVQISAAPDGRFTG